MAEWQPCLLAYIWEHYGIEHFAKTRHPVVGFKVGVVFWSWHDKQTNIYIRIYFQYLTHKTDNRRAVFARMEVTVIM